MKYQDKLHEGLSVEIVVPDGEYEGRYRSRIEEMGVRIISLGVPVSLGSVIPLREGTTLDIIFCDELCAYKFTTMVIDRIAAPLPTIIIEYPKRIMRIQRRQYVRVPVVMPLEYHLLDNNGMSKIKKGSTIDLSGGGILFKTKENIPEKTMIIMKLRIEGVDTELPGFVIRSLKDEQDFYKVSVEFQDITENIRDKIIRYVFDIQREMRKKGLI